MGAGWWRRIWQRKSEEPGNEEEPITEALWQENPYLPWIRQILCSVLPQRGLNYQMMHLAVLDVDEDADTIFWEDKVLQALNDLAADLNALTIFTERPAYFQEYVERMYEENGLLVQMRDKSRTKESNARKKMSSNTLLDFERQGGIYKIQMQEPGLYIPIYKKPWKTAENLDIFVPIGYNTVIVRGVGTPEIL